ncbi:hypothetical protein V495_02054 [Pseudogymnoascus sp. VKM F-4514 (FW-929)]|nr:hypothetical protein V495_02054 [Pseudogymnoascus sp. VKM F-4514 (FW-929)]KFY63184.1 hypothetical protein V497_02090 [Pseudogymnoascus sp. VKM F-4516 (FW-969)]
MPSSPSTATAAATTAASTDNAAGRLPLAAPNATSAAELARAKLTLHSALRHFPDFPIPGIDFVDILPLFATAARQETLLAALEAEVLTGFGGVPDVIVALDARGFLFGPGLALRLGCGFAPVRKAGKIPGPTVQVGFKKEYGEDFFQMQADAVEKGQKVLVVDDIIATGGSAKAAGDLVEKLGGEVMGYLFILELDFLKGRDLLNAPVRTLLAQEEKQ